MTPALYRLEMRRSGDPEWYLVARHNVCHTEAGARQALSMLREEERSAERPYTYEFRAVIYRRTEEILR
jgi:hypothetical protein